MLIFVCVIIWFFFFDSRSDRWWVVDKLSPNMELIADRYKLCLHERDFVLGSRILDNIEESMESSRFMIVVLSNNFMESQVS